MSRRFGARSGRYRGVFVAHPTLRASVAQGLSFGGSGRWAVAHTRPAFPKNAYGPVGIPLIRGASDAGRSTSATRGVIAWGEGPLMPKEISRHRDTRPADAEGPGLGGGPVSVFCERSMTKKRILLNVLSWPRNKEGRSRNKYYQIFKSALCQSRGGKANK